MPEETHKGPHRDQALLTAPRNKTTKRLFIAATRMNDGKTTTSLALFAALRNMTDKVGFIKPVGQRYVEYEGSQVDEDSVLLNRIFNVGTPMQAMSPVVVHSSFTREFLDSPEQSHEALINKICRAFDRAAFQKDYIIVEGTGHAGVGAVFNLSNGHYCCAWRDWPACR
jgi:dethiobiotin synthetase